DHFVSRASWQYDSQNRIVRENFEDATGKIERKEYTYENNSTLPNMKIFENNFLIFDRQYQGDDGRIDFVYFEDGYVGKALYKDGKKISEEFLHNDTVIRSTVFEEEKIIDIQNVQPLAPSPPASSLPTASQQLPLETETLPLIQEENEYIFDE
ncbi:MAG: hypothetical protein ACRC5H_05600, partial [Treponemataceae bacterium]